MGLNFEKGLQDEGNKAAFLKMTFLELSKILSSEPTLERLIAATRISARTQIRDNYENVLLRPQTVSAAHPESKLERALWLHWGLHKSCQTNPTFLKECPHIVSYQVPLYRHQHKRHRNGWGKIDVVGVESRDLTPVVIELKAGGSSESLLRMVLEAVAYGIALQEAWKRGFLRDWKAALTKLTVADDRLINQESLERLPTSLNDCRILCAAPSEYWNGHFEDGRNEDFKAIRHHLTKKGFAVSFVRLDFTVKTFEL
jgi:hypothetical protein